MAYRSWLALVRRSLFGVSGRIKTGELCAMRYCRFLVGSPRRFRKLSAHPDRECGVVRPDRTGSTLKNGIIKI